MTTFHEQLKKQADGIKLRSTEKRELRERVVAYMEYHPLPEHIKAKRAKGAGVAAVPSAIISEPFFSFNFKTRGLQSAMVFGALLFVVGVPTLAERSLPGDMLYPMKVMVNEEVRSTLAFSPYAKVEWEAARLERRLSEARLLAQEGRLTEDAERKVAEAVKEHSESAQETILAMRETNTEDAALAEIAFASVLDAQADIITLHEEQGRLAKEGGSDVTSGTVLALAVQDARTVAASAREEGRVTPERLFALIERETTYAAELFDSIEGDTTDKEAENIARRLADIGRKVERAQALQTKLAEMSAATAHADEGLVTGSSTGEEVALSMSVAAESQAGTLADVASMLRTALTDTRKLISFMTDIEVRQSVDVERLIPITLTDGERIAAVNATLEKVRMLEGDINAREINGTLAAKIERGLDEIAKAIAQADAALRDNQLEAAEAAAAEAEAFARDTFAMVSDSPLKPLDMSTTTASSAPTSTQPVTEGTATSTTSSTPTI